MRTPEEELHRRLHDLADSAGPWVDPLPGVLERARARKSRRLISARLTSVLRAPHRPDWQILGAIAATMMLVLGAYLSWELVGGDSRTATTTARSEPQKGFADLGAAFPATPARCGKQPTSSGDVAGIASMTLAATRTASSGQPIELRAAIRASTNGPEIVTPIRPELLIVEAGTVIGWIDSGPIPEIAKMIPLRVGTEQTLTLTLDSRAGGGGMRLGECPNHSRPFPTGLLPTPRPGTYHLLAVLRYTVSAGGGGSPETSGSLVSQPLTVTIR